MSDVGEAQIALLRAQALRWLRPLGEFVEMTSAASSSPAESGSCAPQALTCERLASAISRATRYGIFRPLCLTRAVALSRMLLFFFFPVFLFPLCLLLQPTDNPTAHAWVKLRHGSQNTTTKHSRIVPLAQVSVAGNPVLSGIMRHRLHRGPRHPGDRLTWDQ